MSIMIHLLPIMRDNSHRIWNYSDARDYVARRAAFPAAVKRAVCSYKT